MVIYGIQYLGKGILILELNITNIRSLRFIIGRLVGLFFNRLSIIMISISHNNWLASDVNLKFSPRKMPQCDYSTLPNDTIVKDLDDLFDYIEGKCDTPLLNENVKSSNNHTIDDDFVPLQVDQDNKLPAKRCLLPEFEYEHLKYTLSCQTSSPLLHDDIGELLHMSDFIDEDGVKSTSNVSKDHLKVSKCNVLVSHQEDHQAILSTRRCLLNEFDTTAINNFESITNAEEDDVGSECNISFESVNNEIDTSEYCSLDDEGLYKHCMPWYLEDSEYYVSKVLYEIRL